MYLPVNLELVDDAMYVLLYVTVHAKTSLARTKIEIHF